MASPITKINPRGINTTGDYVVNSISSTGNVSAGNIKSDHLLYANGSPYAFTTNAAGTNTQVQFNDGNSFAGDANLTFNKTTGTLTAISFVGDGSQLTGLPSSYTDTNANSAIDARVTKSFIDNLGVNANTLNGHSDTYFATSTQGALADSALQPADLTGYATESYVGNAVANLVNSAPAVLDTLAEIANAIGNDASFTTTITNSLANKANTADLSAVAISGNYQDLNNLPTLFDGTYANLTGKPNLFDGEYVSLANKPTLFSGSYLDLTNKPTLFDGEYLSLANRPSLSAVATSGSYTDLTDKPSLFDGTYANLTGKPTLFDGEYASLANKPALFDGTYANLTGKPTLGTAASTNANAYATAAQGSLADTALQSADLTGYATETYVTTAISNIPDPVTVTGNSQPNITSVGTLTGLTVNGNITANYFIGNGSQLTGLPAGYTDSDVATYLPTYTGNLTPGNLTVSTSANLGNVANITITGGTDGQLLTTDGNGVLTWSTPASSGTTVSLDSFTGDGANTAFTLSVSPANVNMITVNYNGSVLLKDSYSITGNVLTLGSAPFNGSKLEVISITNLAGSGGSGSSGPSYSYTEVNANTTMVASTKYIVDTSIANITLTLPASATLGDEISVIDGTGNASSHAITIARNGGNIQGDASDMTVTTDRAAFTLAYYNATQGWLLTNV